MNIENTFEQDSFVKPENALAPTTQEAARELVARTVRTALAGTGQHLGVSRNWLAQHVEHLGLTEAQLETLVAVRTEFRGRLPLAVEFLDQGLTVEDVHGCYRAQRELASMGDKFRNASVKKIARLIRTFAEADPTNEGFDEMIAEIHDVISERYCWVRYVDQSIAIICKIANACGCATIDAALSMIDGLRAKKEGLLPDVENDTEWSRSREDIRQLLHRRKQCQKKTPSRH